MADRRGSVVVLTKHISKKAIDRLIAMEDVMPRLVSFRNLCFRLYGFALYAGARAPHVDGELNLPSKDVKCIRATQKFPVSTRK